MKKKRTFTFHSMLDSHYLLTRIQEEAGQSDLLIDQSENTFKLRIDCNHGGEVFYQARIFAHERDGSLIEGEIITIPWIKSKNKTKPEKAAEVIGYIVSGIVMSPVIILIFLIFGSYELLLLIKNKGKRELPRDEQNLLDFMLNKLGCTQITD